jgi:hypothetical protein
VSTRQCRVENTDDAGDPTANNHFISEANFLSRMGKTELSPSTPQNVTKVDTRRQNPKKKPTRMA